MVKIVVLDRVRPVAKHRNEAILCREPAEDADIRYFQFPHRIVFSPDNTELPCKDERLTTQEGAEKIVNLFSRRSFTHTGRRLASIEDMAQPLDEAGRAIQQPRRLLVSGKLNVNFDDCAVSQQICNCSNLI